MQTYLSDVFLHMLKKDGVMFHWHSVKLFFIDTLLLYMHVLQWPQLM